MYKIIEDCSPYYIRFTHPEIENVISICKRVVAQTNYTAGFTHQILERPIADQILNLIPMSKQLRFLRHRVSMFITQPGHYYRAHKDGLNFHIGINYTINILDSDCIVNWYSDEELKDYPIDNLFGKKSREADGFDRKKHTPLKSTTFIEGECILFNTEIFHDVDNTASSNQRVILTLRLAYPEKIFFEDAKKILFSE